MCAALGIAPKQDKSIFTFNFEQNDDGFGLNLARYWSDVCQAVPWVCSAAVCCAVARVQCDQRANRCMECIQTCLLFTNVDISDAMRRRTLRVTRPRPRSGSGVVGNPQAQSGN